VLKYISELKNASKKLVVQMQVTSYKMEKEREENQEIAKVHENIKSLVDSYAKGGENAHREKDR